MYAKTLKLNKGVENVLLFQFLNQDQKPVDISGCVFTFRVISQDGTTLLLTKDLTVLQTGTGTNIQKKGQAKLTTTIAELENITAQPAGYSIEIERITSESFEAVFTDDYAGARGMVDIVDSVYPEFIASKQLTLPPRAEPQGGYKRTMYTSELQTQGKETVTFQIDFDQFTGNIIAQGSNEPPIGWMDIGDVREYINQDTRDLFNVTGNFRFLRLQVNQVGNNASVSANVSGGSVSSLSLTGGGSAWIGSPRVVFDGVGAGATATATVSGGQITAVNLIDGGTGYSQTPNVKVDAGVISSIHYR